MLGNKADLCSEQDGETKQLLQDFSDQAQAFSLQHKDLDAELLEQRRSQGSSRNAIEEFGRDNAKLDAT